jgi:hypothetical protein
MSRSRSCGNWVDRGTWPDAKLQQVLAHFLGCPAIIDEPGHAWLGAAATEVGGMVAANVSEVQIASYLRALGRSRGRSAEELQAAPLVAVALWHIAKVAEVRDALARARARSDSAAAGAPEPLGEWLAARLLTAEELAAYEAEGTDSSATR